MEAIGERGELDVSGVRALEDVRTGYSVFKDGDVVVAKITPCFENGKGAVIRNTLSGIGFGTTELHVLTPGPELNSQFLYYITMSSEFRRRGAARMTGAAGQQRVPEDFIVDFPVIAFPLSQQQAIVRFLDQELARLDSLIAAKTRQIELISEKRKAVIATAVTRGIDVTAKMRDPGLLWLGKVPAHWKTERIRWLFRERDDRGEPELPLMEVSIANGVSVREFTGEKIESTAADFNTYKVARRNDIAFNKMRMWQGAVGVSPVDGLVSPDYVVAAARVQLLPDYFGFLFRTDAFSAECGRRSHGLTWDRLRIYWEEFREIKVPYPPIDEQRAIVDFITRETAKIDSVRAATERTIALLKERRSALIAAAVNGWIHMRLAA